MPLTPGCAIPASRSKVCTRDSVTIVIENTVPVTATIAPAMADNVACAVGVVVRIHSGSDQSDFTIAVSSSGTVKESKTAPAAHKVGTNQ